mgnify:CR=1 FL=1
MKKLIIFLYRVVNYYLYFIVMACFLAIVPNINPNYPLFHRIFQLAGFYIIPDIFGFIISPMILMTVLALIMIGLGKIYDKYYASKEPQVIVMSPEDFMKKMIKLQTSDNDDIQQNTKDDNSESEKEKESEE